MATVATARRCEIVDSGSVCGGKVYGRGMCSKHYQRWYKHGDPLGFAPRPTPEERFWSKVSRDGPLPERRPELGPCWVWTDAPNDRGYGDLYVEGHKVYAHRYSYALNVGAIPESLQIDHLCRNRICVRPDHLEPVTSDENTRRGDCAKVTSERRRAITHCVNGHEFDEANTYWHRGRRHCRACKRIRDKERQKQLKAERHARGLKRPPTMPRA